MTRTAPRILIVDDNRDAADSLATLVRLWGYPADVAYDGEEAYRRAVSSPPDCVLSDINMPGMDGYDLARKVRATPGLGRLKLVAVSAYSSDDHARRTAEAGFDHRLTKPADPDELRGLLTMLEDITRLAARTETLARQNVSLAGETKQLLEEVREDIREVKQDIRELREEIKDVRERQEG